MNPILVTLSSLGTSRFVNLDWRSGAKTSFTVTGSSSGTFAFTVEGTLDDLQLTASPVWFSISSAALTTNSSQWQIAAPLAGLRISSTALSSAALALRILQDHGY